MKLGISTRLSSVLSLIVAVQIGLLLLGGAQGLAADVIAPTNTPATESVTPENSLVTQFYYANRRVLSPKRTRYVSGGDPRTAVPVPPSPFDRTLVQLSADEIAAEVRLRQVLAEIMECSTNDIKDGSFQVSAASGKMANYNDRNHILLIRATRQDLNRIEDLLYPLNRTSRQFEIAIQWLVLDSQEANAVLRPGVTHKKNTGELLAATIMDAKQAEAMIETLSRQKSCRHLGSPVLTVRDSRECALALDEHGLRLSLLPSLVNEAKATFNLDAQLELTWNPGDSSHSQSSQAQLKLGEFMVLSQHFTTKTTAGKPQNKDVLFFISTKLLPPTTIPSWAMAEPGKKADPAGQ